METQELIAALGYADSPHFLTAPRFDEVPAHAHVFRRAQQRCSLQGVYLLRDETAKSSSATPVVYVAEAKSQEDADEIHRQVWNQNTVPFLIVRTPRGVRLYSGFVYRKPQDPEQEQEGVLRTLRDFQGVTLELAAFQATQIDRGRLFRDWGEKIRPEQRVDHRLLGNLEALGQNLHEEGVRRETAHALVGKLVYLRYLRDRDILSNRRLAGWEIQPEVVFGRGIDVEEVGRLNFQLDEWLNGEIFPLSLSDNPHLSLEQIERTAGVFLGDDARTGQLHLDFQAYDFSHIPIETLSTIYEQFLAIEGTSRESGAFYTPVPLVNFMVAEMEAHRPLEVGMRVLDPACGSGAFLVQCYRHLIEKRMAQVQRKLRPTELRDLLVRQIFGVDRDGDACRVAELSLVLTMLDYIDPPDLPNFKLPKLHDRNIYQCDFFDKASVWETGAGRENYDWILGNPPWVELPKESDREAHILSWITNNGVQFPITKRQSAEAFAWKVLDYSSQGSVIGLLLPAMTLFKQRDTFKRRFFAEVGIVGVANFTNLRRDLFVRFIGGKKRIMEIPVASIFYKQSDSPHHHTQRQAISVYSPFLANQEIDRRESTKKRAKIWDLVINSSEIQFVETRDIVRGGVIPWKLAMWGTHRDQRLLKKTQGRFKNLAEWSIPLNLKIHPGLELKSEDSRETTEPAPEVIGQKRWISKASRNLEGIYTLVNPFLEVVPQEECFVRKGRKEKPLSVCQPPHIILSAARTFSVYTDEFVVILPRQIGIAAAEELSPLLKALSLYLSSDFVKYFEFFKSPQWGIRDGRSTLDTLKQVPVPSDAFGNSQLKIWIELHRDLAEASKRHLTKHFGGSLAHSGTTSPLDELRGLEAELNRLVEKALGLSERERWLVRDLVHVRMSLTDGKLGEPAVRKPPPEDLRGYGEMLASELNAFLPDDLRESHQVTIWSGDHEGLVAVELLPVARDGRSRVVLRDERDTVTREMTRLQSQHRDFTRQWIYFDRNLFVYDRERVLIFKPLQQLWWTRSQATSDADEIIASALTPGETA